MLIRLPALLDSLGVEPKSVFLVTPSLSDWYGVLCFAALTGSSYYRYQRRPDYYGSRIDPIGDRERVVFNIGQYRWEDISSVFADEGDGSRLVVAFRFHNRRLTLFLHGSIRFAADTVLRAIAARMCEVILDYCEAMMNQEKSVNGRD